MTSKALMKRYRNEIRKFLKATNKDFHNTQYLNELENRIGIQITVWYERLDAIVVRIYDTQKPTTSYDSTFCRYAVIYMALETNRTLVGMWKIYQAFNDIACAIRQEKREN